MVKSAGHVRQLGQRELAKYLRPRLKLSQDRTPRSYAKPPRVPLASAAFSALVSHFSVLLRFLDSSGLESLVTVVLGHRLAVVNLVAQ